MQGSPCVWAGLGGVVQGNCVPGPGAPQLAEAVLGVWDVQQLLETPPLPCSTGTGGVAALGCSWPLLLLCPWGPHFSSGQGFPPVCDYWRTAQPQPRGSPAVTRGSVPAWSQGTMWPLGLDPTPFQIHSGECQVTVKPCSPPAMQMSLAVMLNCWSAAGPDPTTTKSDDVSWLLGLWIRPEHKRQAQHHAELSA